MVLVPSGYKKEVFKSFSGSLYKAAGALILKSKASKYSVIPVSTSGIYDNAPKICRNYVDGIGDGFSFSIELLAPYSELSFHVTEVLKAFNKNDISIAFNIRFGHYRFFFGGDVMNESIGRFQDDKLKNTVFIKIPHHASTTSSILPDRYLNLLTGAGRAIKAWIMSVTTTFEEHRTHLTDSMVLDKYKLISKKVLQTQGQTQTANYGIWSFVYKYNSRVPVDSCMGDASVYYP